MCEKRPPTGRPTRRHGPRSRLGRRRSLDCVLHSPHPFFAPLIFPSFGDFSPRRLALSHRHPPRRLRGRSWPKSKIHKPLDLSESVLQVAVDHIDETGAEIPYFSIFCGQVYIFDAVDCKQIFASPTIVDAVKQAPSSKH